MYLYDQNNVGLEKRGMVALAQAKGSSGRERCLRLGQLHTYLHMTRVNNK